MSSGVLLCGLLTVSAANGQQPDAATPPAGKAPMARRPHRVPKPGVATPGVSVSMADIKPVASFPVEGSPDWSVVTKDSLWVTSGRTNHVVQLIPATNTVGLSVDVSRPCSGLANGFGSVWAPSCGDHEVLRIDPKTGKTIATIAADPANSEGGITVGAGAVWIVTKPATLVRIDPKKNAITASYPLPAGSDNPTFADGFVWVSSYDNGQLLKVNPKTGEVAATIAVGPKPRFLTVGAGSIWTLNQGDGTVSRVNMKTGKLVATIVCGVPGTGGEITFGAGRVWATMFEFPITEIDPATNTVVKQWGGPGGDGIRFGFHSIWLSNGRLGTVSRIAPILK
ncbi:PQQ-binding-like beta-propeller repeat protein [Granulicella sp. 5B5]|uniref:Vgb family protein n=1 Tax=Granulicella sp. 5B5 TaxID=1617967 RepID=UPI0021056AEE|nr:PQQ-binding-like beta-propeller repeat protein [Granulicella sp. 5B5]